MDLKELKSKYAELAGKYKLPKFEELNENFEIERSKRIGETLLRTIRKVMMEKIVNSAGFLEFLLNPVNAPRMYMIYLKSMKQEDMKEIDKVYGELSALILSSLKLEVDYSEKGEAEAIKQIAKKWEEVKPGFRKIFSDIQKPEKSEERKEKTYFG